MSKARHERLQERLLRARRDYYQRCLSRLRTETLQQLVLDFQYVRFDANNNRKEQELAKVLVAHIIPYSLKEERFKDAEANLANFAFFDAKALFTKRPDSGESGELLLYFLIEAVLGAPQVLAKMSLKTSAAMEVHGADGIHVRLAPQGQPLDVFLGESKLHGTASSAISEAIESIASVRQSGIGRELVLATENFKWLDADVQGKILQLLDPNSPCHNCRIHFVALVGFDLPPHGNRKSKETHTDFLAQYSRRATALTELTREKLEKCDHPWDDVIHIFFVPFQSVAAFREEFLRCLTG